MRARAAVGLLVVTVAAGFTGHFVGGKAVAAKPLPPLSPTLSVSLPPELAAPAAHGTHILWLFIQGRWRAVPS